MVEKMHKKTKKVHNVRENHYFERREKGFIFEANLSKNIVSIKLYQS